MRGRWWLVVAAVVAVAAVAAAPLLGGPSLSAQIAGLTARQKKLETRVKALAKATGARGPAGPAGPKGETGATGPAGTPPALVAQVGFAASGTIDTTPTLVATATLAHAGDQLLEGNLVLTNGGAGGVLVTCRLHAPGGAVVDTAMVRLAAAGGLDTATLAPSGGITGATAGTVQMICQSTSAGVTWADANLIALG